LWAVTVGFGTVGAFDDVDLLGGTATAFRCRFRPNRCRSAVGGVLDTADCTSVMRMAAAVPMTPSTRFTGGYYCYHRTDLVSTVDSSLATSKMFPLPLALFDLHHVLQ